MKLYEIDERIQNFFLNNIDEETGEVLNYEELENLKMQREEKIENIALAYKNYLSDVKALKEEKEKLAKRQKQAEKSAESCKKYLEYALQGELLQTSKVAISYRKSEVVVIEDGAELADDYLIFKSPEPNKTAIKNALKNGELIQGCSVEEKNNIQIK